MYEQIISYKVNCCVFFHLCLFPSSTVLVFLNLFLLIYAELGNLPRIIIIIIIYSHVFCHNIVYTDFRTKCAFKIACQILISTN